MQPHYPDPRTGKHYPLTRPPLALRRRQRRMMLSALPGISRDDIDTRERSVWRYRAALPLAYRQPRQHGRRLHAPGRRNPGAGCGHTSSSNGSTPPAASRTAAPASWCPSSSSWASSTSSKTAPATAARRLPPPAPRPASRSRSSRPATRPAQGRADTRFRRRGAAGRRPARGIRIRGHTPVGAHLYASHNWHPFFLQGTKSIAYELWEDLGFKAPDNIIIPAAPAAMCWAATSASASCVASGQIRSCPDSSRPSR